MFRLVGIFCSAWAAPVVHTGDGGILRGRREGAADVFLGLRYARAKRFEVAQLESLGNETRDATEQGPKCWRPRDFPCIPAGEKVEDACKSPLAMKMSEDCFFLDLYRPHFRSNRLLPVMVWIHGGGMTIGDSGDGHSGAAGNGTRLAEQGVIVVSLNYRLGPLGFLPLRQLGAANGTGGMNGLYDQIVALKWIQANIEAFGGDPQRVTLFGCSAGSLSICTLSTSPLAQGLFHQAILESGPCIGPWGPGTAAEGQAVLQRFMVSAAVSQQELYELPPADIFWGQGQDQVDIEFPGYWLDGWVAPEHPARRLRQGVHLVPTAFLMGATSRDGVLGTDYIAAKDLPTTAEAYAPAVRKHWRPRNSTGGIFGVNRLLPTDVGAEVLRAYNWNTFTEVGGPAAAFKAADGDYHVLCPLRRLALEALKADTSQVQIYFYYFTYGPLKSSGCSKPDAGTYPVRDWANHGDEKDFVFGNYEKSAVCPMDAWEVQLSRTMQAFWANFAKTGNPNFPSADGRIAQWQKFQANSSQALRIGDALGLSKVKQVQQLDACDFWDQLTSNYSVEPKITLVA